MGAADVVPGVSGGTMAYILGIYGALLDAIKSFDVIWLKACVRLDISAALRLAHFQFLIPLVLGIFLAIMFFTRVVPLPTYIVTDPEWVYGLFFGLIIGSILMLQRQIVMRNISSVLPLLVGIMIGISINSLVPTTTPDAAWFVFISGALAITAMILPGISGSFILLILNKYAYVFDAIGRFDFLVIVPFALGAITGLLVFSRILSYLMHQHHQTMLLIINGFLITSLWKIWPFQERLYIMVRDKQRLLESTPIFPDSLNATVTGSLGMIILGCFLVFMLHRLAQHKQAILSR